MLRERYNGELRELEFGDLSATLMIINGNK